MSVSQRVEDPPLGNGQSAQVIDNLDGAGTGMSTSTVNPAIEDSTGDSEKPRTQAASTLSVTRLEEGGAEPSGQADGTEEINEDTRLAAGSNAPKTSGKQGKSVKKSYAYTPNDAVNGKNLCGLRWYEANKAALDRPKEAKTVKAFKTHWDALDSSAKDLVQIFAKQAKRLKQCGFTSLKDTTIIEVDTALSEVGQAV
ncbi:hypothetical protein FOMPIDRAFT_101451 [Fomitopsis schrenkii]|uniref:Uncharacterized protein n=1 Tax=Fomitopsis schrenkii TaxID=2126942 RepID=S8F5J2_FOMSC|nr:hypothetical protein FOMPIDRAFT_101451 [Fomitopsis schrenkii]